MLEISNRKGIRQFKAYRQIHAVVFRSKTSFPTRFVSHTWTRDRRDQMCRNLAEFTRLKAAELKEVLDEIAAEKRVIRRESQTHSLLDELLMQVPTDPIMLWIDKVSVFSWNGTRFVLCLDSYFLYHILVPGMDDNRLLVSWVLVVG